MLGGCEGEGGGRGRSGAIVRGSWLTDLYSPPHPYTFLLHPSPPTHTYAHMVALHIHPNLGSMPLWLKSSRGEANTLHPGWEAYTLNPGGEAYTLNPGRKAYTPNPAPPCPPPPTW